MPVSAPAAVGLIDELLLQWQEARECGRPCAAEDLCAGHPDVLEPLRERIAALEAMHALLGLDPLATVTPQSPHIPPAGPHGPGVMPEIPGYEMLAVLDEGGMGTVYLARQPKLQRQVAVKMVRAGRLARADQLERFRAEAEAVARLRHANIIQIYEVGEWQGQPYFSMEYVAGGNLAGRLARGPIPPREAAELLRTLAQAVHHAHAHGVVHRDLKPANVLLRRKPAGTGGDNDPNPGEGCLEPLVGDFGLAKLLDGEGPTRTGVVLGTPQYLAPEQAEGRDVGPPTDVHALGGILYEMLAGRPPFLGANTLEVLDQVRGTDPVPPSRVRQRVPAELEAICLKCLAKESSRRYATAAELADDLGRYLRGEPVVARRTPVWWRAARWVRRKPLLAGLAGLSACAVLALLGVWVGFTYQLKAAAAQLQEERDEANRQHALADEGRRKAEAEASRAEYLLFRCMSAIDEHARATEQSREMKQTTGEPGSIPFVVARVYAASAKVYRADDRLPEADRERFAERYAGKAVELLERANDHRYFDSARNRQKLQTDADLTALHDRADYQRLLAKLGMEIPRREGAPQN
jgi:serine/threonine-protein kinase